MGVSKNHALGTLHEGVGNQNGGLKAVGTADTLHFAVSLQGILQICGDGAFAANDVDLVGAVQTVQEILLGLGQALVHQQDGSVHRGSGEGIGKAGTGTNQDILGTNAGFLQDGQVGVVTVVAGQTVHIKAGLNQIGFQGLGHGSGAAQQIDLTAGLQVGGDVIDQGSGSLGIHQQDGRILDAGQVAAGEGIGEGGAAGHDDGVKLGQAQGLLHGIGHIEGGFVTVGAVDPGDGGLQGIFLGVGAAADLTGILLQTGLAHGGFLNDLGIAEAAALGNILFTALAGVVVGLGAGGMEGLHALNIVAQGADYFALGFDQAADGAGGIAGVAVFLTGGNLAVDGAHHVLVGAAGGPGQGSAVVNQQAFLPGGVAIGIEGVGNNLGEGIGCDAGGVAYEVHLLNAGAASKGLGGDGGQLLGEGQAGDLGAVFKSGFTDAGEAFAQFQSNKTCAVVECVAADGHQGGGQGQFLQTGAVVEGTGIDGLDTFGNHHFGQAGAVIEGAFFQCGDLSFQSHGLQAGAAGEGVAAQSGNRFGDGHFFQTDAAGEGANADGDHGFGNGDGLQRGAALKGLDGDLFQILGEGHSFQLGAACEHMGTGGQQGVGHGDLGQVHTIVESVGTQTGDAVFHNQGLDLVGGLAPGCQGVGRIVVHDAGAEDGHDAGGLVQSPLGFLTAGAADDHIFVGLSLLRLGFFGFLVIGLCRSGGLGSFRLFFVGFDRSSSLGSFRLILVGLYRSGSLRNFGLLFVGLDRSGGFGNFRLGFLGLGGSSSFRNFGFLRLGFGRRGNGGSGGRLNVYGKIRLSLVFLQCVNVHGQTAQHQAQGQNTA